MKRLTFIAIFIIYLNPGMPVMGQENVSGLNLPTSFFPVLCWDPQHGWNNQHDVRLNGLESIRDCHFTLAGIVQPRDIKDCEALGLKAFAYGDTDTVTMRQWNNLWDDTTLTDKVIEEKIRKMVERYGDSEAIIGYFICDEPGASMFPRLAKAVECVRKYAPGKLAYINLFPDYATIGARNKSQLETETYQEHLDRYASEVKPAMISYDNYMVQYSMDLEDESHFKSYYQNLLSIRNTALKNGLPFWNIVSSNQIRPFTTIPSPANLLFQAYTSLAAGARGVTWYTYYSRGYGYAPIDSCGKKTQTWYYLKEVNRQLAVLGPIMNQMSNTGVYFTSPAPLPDLPEMPGKLVREIDSESPVMLGEFRSNDGGDYAMVVNLSLEKSSRFKIELREKNTAISIISSADGEPIPYDADQGHWLVAGQGVLLKF
jgi:hypothetical protein